MRAIKILGLGAGLALLATALIGGGSAAAVTICMEKGNAMKTCPEGKRYLAREYRGELEAETLAILQGEGYFTRCEKSTFNAKTLKKEDSPLPAEVTEITLDTCEGCTGGAKFLNLPYNASITSSGDGTKDGNLVLTKKAGPPRVELIGCGGGLFNCTFGAAEEKIDLEVTGGSGIETNALVLAAVEQFQFVSGNETVCKKIVKFTATYVFTEPTAVWITAFP
jgi:hypothetical protein